jgi:hypothetical protein
MDRQPQKMVRFDSYFSTNNKTYTTLYYTTVYVYSTITLLISNGVFQDRHLHISNILNLNLLQNSTCLKAGTNREQVLGMFVARIKYPEKH